MALPHGIDLVIDDEFRDVLADLRRQLLGGEVHPRDVEGVAVHEPRRVGLHHLDGRLDGVGHVHHVQPAIGLQEAGVVLVADRLVEDLHRVVRGAAAGRGAVGDDAREAHAARVDAEALMVVVAEQLAGHLGDAVHRGRALEGVLRRVVLRRGGAEGTDGARHEDAAIVDAGHFEDAVEAAHVHVPGHLRLALAHRREERDQVVDGADLVALHDVLDLPLVGAVEEVERPLGAQQLLAAHHADVGRDDLVGAVARAQGGDHFGADLPKGSRDEDLRLHVPPGRGYVQRKAGKGCRSGRRGLMLCGSINTPRSSGGARTGDARPRRAWRRRKSSVEIRLYPFSSVRS